MSHREDILNAFKAVLDAIVDGEGESVVKYTEIDKISIVDLEAVPFPACFMYMQEQIRDRDSSSNAVIGANLVTWTANVIIEMWVDGSADSETTLAYIQEAFERNYLLSGAACYSTLLSMESFIIDMDKEIKGVFLSFEVVFRHDRFVP